MDILKILQTTLDEFNRHHGERLYYIEDGDLIYNGNEPQTVCSVEWIDRVLVFAESGAEGVIVDNHAELTPVTLTAKGPDMAAVMVAKSANTSGIKH
jgi:hypothetical protein